MILSPFAILFEFFGGDEYFNTAYYRSKKDSMDRQRPEDRIQYILTFYHKYADKDVKLQGLNKFSEYLESLESFEFQRFQGLQRFPLESLDSLESLEF